MNKGFAALILIIYISTLMLAFSFIQGIEIGHFFDQTKAKQYRLMSYYYAYSCIDQAFLTLTHDYFFKTEKEIEFPDLNCSILSVSGQNAQKIIKVHGKYKNINVFRVANAHLFDDHIEIISIE
jgi:hypothetical protein